MISTIRDARSTAIGARRDRTRQTADRYLRQWGYDHVRMTRAPPAVRFQARRSNELWQFDLSLMPFISSYAPS